MAFVEGTDSSGEISVTVFQLFIVNIVICLPLIE